MKTRRLISALLALLLLTSCAPAPQEDANTATLFAMDTVMEFTVYGANTQGALKQAEDCVKGLEGLLSTTDENSEIYAANHSGGEAVAVSEDTAQVLQAALELCQDTGGALDVSIFPVVRAWGFTTGEYRVPGAEELSGLLTQVDYSRIELAEGKLVVPAGMEVDLGAVAKGYTGDRVMTLFRQAGVTSGMVSLGGNVQTLGSRPDGEPWRIAIRDPAGESYAGVVEVEDQAVITSGGYERYFEEGGQRYWHIIDPNTGCPAQNGLVSVTVVCDSGVLGDGLSTALFVMGREKAVDYWRSREGFDFVLIDEDGAVTVSEGLEGRFSLYGDWADHRLEVARR